MTVRVLGPLDVGGATLSPRERTVLSALIVRRDGGLTPAELADAVWREKQPSTWTAQVRNAVARIRSRLGPEAIRTVGDSYRLGIASDAIDVVQFETLVAEARRQSLLGAHDRSVAVYQRALELWRGQPLPDVASWPPGEVEALRLEEVRRSVEDELLDERLRAGEHATVIADAERLVRQEPLREKRWALLALANYRAERQAEAMAVIRAARTRLADDLGIDPSRGLVDLETAMLRQDPSLDSPRAHTAPGAVDAAAVCPYRGLAAYEADDRAFFFGRDSDTQALLARCRPKSVITIVGSSGSGKSSLLKAGLIPRLREQGWRALAVTPDSPGIATMRETFGGGSAVLGIDQAEELLALQPEIRSDLAARAADWVDQGGCLVLTLRSDFLDRATAVPYVGAALGRGLYAPAPLDEMMLREAITGPADAAGLHFEPGLVELILRDADAHPGILPALSHALAATWARREGTTMTVSGYEAAGGIAGAIAQSAEGVYGELAPPAQDICRALMMRLLERTPQGETIRRRVPLAVLTDDPTRRSVVERLVAARLLTVDGESAMIAHEAVGSAWPRLDGWLTEDAANAAMLRQVEAAAVGWDAAGRPDDDLQRGARLQAAIEWRERTSPDLTDVEAAFLTAAALRQRDELHELQLRAERERRNNRTLKAALSAAAILLVAAIVSVGLAVVRGVEAVAAAENGRIDALVATSQGVTDTDLDAAALIAAELYRRWPDDARTRVALERVLAASTGLVRSVVVGTDAWMGGAVIPETSTALVVARDDSDAGADAAPRVLTIDLDTGGVVRELDGVLPNLDIWGWWDVVISPDGSTAFLQAGALRRADDPGSCCVNYLTALDIDSGVTMFDPVLLDARTGDWQVFSPDMSRAYFMHPITGAPSWIDLDTGQVHASAAHVPEDYEGIPGRYYGIALIDDVLYIGEDWQLGMYEAATLDRIGTIELPGEFASWQVRPDGEGGLLVFGNFGGARIALPSGDLVWQQPVDVLACPIRLTFTAQGFLCSTGPGLYEEYRLDSGEPTGRGLEGLVDMAAQAYTLPDDDIAVITHHNPASVQRWRLGDAPPLTDDTTSTAQLRDAACAAAGRELTAEEWQTYLGDEPQVPTCSRSD